MSFADDLKKVADTAVYPSRGKVDIRWGQILREDPDLKKFMVKARERGLLIPLWRLARVRSGVVPRANAFFLVRELPFDEVPERFQVTKRDYQRIAVIEDGIKTRHKIERVCLRPVLKGPEVLRGPTSTAKTDERLFDCQDKSKEDLRKLHANGALAYLKRGETVDYRVSEDSLKGGIPAQRSNVKGRKPYWYSLHSPDKDSTQLVVPEHFDRRFVASLIPAEYDAVVIDKLFSIEPREGIDSEVLLATLNSLLTWYQLEMRGRTQLGEGVLEVKIADWNGVLVLDPQALVKKDATALIASFDALRKRDVAAVDDEMVDPERVSFDEHYLSLCGASDPASLRQEVERELRAAMSERHERARSVAEAKAVKSASKKVTASVDAFASRIAAALEPYPDPRQFIGDVAEGDIILISNPWEGRLTVGEDLLSQGQVYAADQVIANAGDVLAAQYVRAVLLHDPEATTVTVPRGERLVDTMSQWEAECKAWRVRFEDAATKTLSAVADERTRNQIRNRALLLLHAQ